jgi:CRISPR-associated endonuclease/helicase Cas3
MMLCLSKFPAEFEILVGFQPLSWQRRLFAELLLGNVPAALDLPTGLGKTSVMAIWLLALAHDARLPRRLVYVVDRRVVVDQATAEAVKMRENLDDELKGALQLGERALPISTLRGQYVDNREWLADPAMPAIVVGTVDMIGSRLLFSGYGVSRGMRPYHAGLLGADALVVLDEAHLVPPFTHLLRTIERYEALRPSYDGDRALLPRFAVLPLSATQRDSGAVQEGMRAPFRLEEDDVLDPIVAKRLGARKRLRLVPLDGKNGDEQLAEAALALARKDGGCSRVVVFCDRRDKQDDGGGPSARGVADEIERLARAAKVDIHRPELLVGARRVRERDDVATLLRDLGFLGEKNQLEKPAFLVATSAGEVGVDIDADHMVCDLVAWERMVQRLGRVNRRGQGDAEIMVFWSEPAAKNAKAPTELEKRALTAFASKAMIENLRQIDGLFDASPGALLGLAERARSDSELGTLVAKATTPEPLRPPLTRAHVEAWSMTSLAVHTGRPDVGPWLRGWIEEEKPQTTVAWRKFLPVRVDGAPTSDKEIDEFFEAAPPHVSEGLETETLRVVPWLMARSRAAAKDGQIGERDIVAFALEPNGDLRRKFRLTELIEAANEKKRKEQLEKSDLGGTTLVVDLRLGGLKDGLLDDEATSQDMRCGDDGGVWPADIGFRIRSSDSSPEDDGKEWLESFRFDVERSDEGESLRRLIVEGLNEEKRAQSLCPQLLHEHHSWTAEKARALARAVGLEGDDAKALEIAARLHDEGKRADRWQRAFNAERDRKKLSLAGPLAKTRGPINQALLDGYRHEFGSLPYVVEDAEFQQLPGDLQDLVLHLVAAHHGGARPLISTKSCDDAPPSALEARAREVALRFARLQKIWGPWGLAWWEALLRAADQQASRDNDSPEREAE